MAFLKDFVEKRGIEKPTKIFASYHVLKALHKSGSCVSSKLQENFLKSINTTWETDYSRMDTGVSHDLREWIHQTKNMKLIDFNGPRTPYYITDEGKNLICDKDSNVVTYDVYVKECKNYPTSTPPPIHEKKYWLLRHDLQKHKLDDGSRDENKENMKEGDSFVLFYIEESELFFTQLGIVKNAPNRRINNEKIRSFVRDSDKEYEEDKSGFKCPSVLKKKIQDNEKWDEDVSAMNVEEKIFKQIELIGRLPTLDRDMIEKIHEELGKSFYIERDTLDEILVNLISGKNILLAGPVGSGKTYLAKYLPKIAWEEFGGGYFSEVYTATADWTTQDVIGGIYPMAKDKSVTYGIQKGCVYETVWKNLLRYKMEVTRDDGTNYRGVWLVIDEFNRANIDRAFGQLFTALEYHTLKVPTTGSTTSGDPEPFKEITIPKDYRIIGTLNTADKHFLHTLSDALKRRFAIIEIQPPKNMTTELKYIIRQVLVDLKEADPWNSSIEVLEEIDKLNERQKPKKSNEWKSLHCLYFVMLCIRSSKQLGTELLISMFKFMLIYSSKNQQNQTRNLNSEQKSDSPTADTQKKLQNWDKGLDLALRSTVLPQIESLPYQSLEVVDAVLRSLDQSEFKGGSRIKKLEYKPAIKRLLHCLEPPEGSRQEENQGNVDEKIKSLIAAWKPHWGSRHVKLESFCKGIKEVIMEKDPDYELDG